MRRTLHHGDKGDDVRQLQTSINERLRARDAPGHMIAVDGVFGPKTRWAMRYAAYLLGMDTKRLRGLLRGGIDPDDQRFVKRPGKREPLERKRGTRRLAAHRKARAKQKKAAASSNAKRQRIVAEAEKAVANYRRNPGAYHYLAGGRANTIYLRPTPRDWRSDCSQFAAAVYKGAGLPSPASVSHQWASTFTMIKAPGVIFVDKAHRKPGMLGMYGTRSSPHHVEIFCGDKFIGHGSPPIDSLTPGEPDYYLDFPFLNN
jgi:cell wall-associated NlpC family hydrolase